MATDAIEDVVDDFFLMEDIDLTDETVLRRLSHVVDDVLGARRGVSVSVLSAEQWETALDRLLPAQLRRSVRAHFHVLAAPDRPGHLLVGPATLAGLNEGSREITGEVVYQLIKIGEPTLSPLFHRGVADLLAREVARRIEVEIFTHNYPHESAVCDSLVAMLQRDHGGFGRLEWLAQLRIRPAQFFLAVRRGAFGAYWLARAKSDPAISPRLPNRPRKTSLTQMLTDPSLTPRDEFVSFTMRCLSEYKVQSEPAGSGAAR